MRALQLTALKLRWTGFETHTRQRQLSVPSRHAPDLFKEGLAMMEAFLAKDRRPVRLLGLSVSKFLREGESMQEGAHSPAAASARSAWTRPPTPWLSAGGSPPSSAPTRALAHDPLP